MRLDVPDQVKRFGAGAKLELRGLRNALRQELSRPGVKRLRIYLDGRLDRWNIADWSVAPDLFRWRTDDVEVELLIPEEARDGLDPAVANLLANLVEVSGATLFVRGSLPSTEALAVEIEGSAGSVRWVVIDEDGRAPGADWGCGTESGICIKAVSSEPRSDSHGSLELSASDLRRTPEASVGEVRIGSDLNGSARGFGVRFWDLVKGQAPRLGRQLEVGGPISEIRYIDRYVRHPFTVRLFIELVTALTPSGGKGTRLAVRSASYDVDHAWAHRIHHPWPQASDRDRVGDELARLRGFEPSFETIAPRHLPHARELEIVWASGRSVVLRLDHGLGYWEGSTAFDFSASHARQARTLNRTRLDVKARHPTHPTIVYVTAVRGAG